MAANPFNYDPFPKTAEFILEQKQLQDKFEYYRLHGSDGWDMEARAATIAGRAVPAAAHGGPGAVVEPAGRWVLYTYSDEVEAADIEEDAIEFTIKTVNDANMRDKLAAMGMRFVRVLGWVSTCTLAPMP